MSNYANSTIIILKIIKIICSFYYSFYIWPEINNVQPKHVF